jgi:transcriptional regulator with GAF, ATPase, and Fis domain
MPSAVMNELESLVSGMVQRGAKLDDSHFAHLAESIGRVFSVGADEVALFAITPDGKFLNFRVPRALQEVGQIPVNSASALVARTARENRPEAINRFAVVPHASVFEAVKLNDEETEPIQKIMSVAIAAKGKVVGVVQVCRKAKAKEDVADFSSKDLHQLGTIAETLASVLPLYEV